MELKNFENWIREMFMKRQKSEFCYHNLEHTLMTVGSVKKIGAYYHLSDEDLENLFLAGWMHDIGYWEGKGDGHEVRGAQFAEECLFNMGFGIERIEKIKSLILSTTMPQEPKNLLEKIICDADLFHLSTEQFHSCSLLLKKEVENSGQNPIPLLDWLKGTYRFMKDHTYHTSYALDCFLPGKEKNMEFLEKEIKATEAKERLVKLF